MNIYYKMMLRSVAAHFNVALETPWKNLPDDFKKVLLHGSGESDVEFRFWRAGSQHTISRPFEGVLPNLERLFTESESEFVRNRIKPYMSPQFCDTCKGKRLKPEILAVTLGRREQVPASSRQASACPANALARANRATSQTVSRQDACPRFPACPSWTFARCRWNRRMNFSPRSS